MIITQEQKNRLKELLTEREYKHLMQYVFDIFQFQTELDDLIVSRFDENDENTEDSELLQRLYDEIYNQNEAIDEY